MGLMVSCPRGSRFSRAGCVVRHLSRYFNRGRVKCLPRFALPGGEVLGQSAEMTWATQPTAGELME